MKLDDDAAEKYREEEKEQEGSVLRRLGIQPEVESQPVLKTGVLTEKLWRLTSLTSSVGLSPSYVHLLTGIHGRINRLFEQLQSRNPELQFLNFAQAS